MLSKAQLSFEHFAILFSSIFRQNFRTKKKIFGQKIQKNNNAEHKMLEAKRKWRNRKRVLKRFR
jgi:hypothetical protein